MRRVLTVFRTTVGLKVLMAVTGALFILYVIAHMMGNLKAFQGPEKFNAYAEFLREVGYPVLGHSQFLWIVRIVLIGAVAIHVVAALALTRMSWRARPVGYHRSLEPDASTYASRTMRWGGLLLFAFVTYHLMHLTTGSAHPDFVANSAYHNVVTGFKVWWAAAVYIVMMIVLGLHLYHGLWSGLRTLGAHGPVFERWRRPVSAVIAVAIVAGFIAVPVGVLMGVIE
ncbi:MAG: succinate dehydrogenase cytochrome b subunit [Gemmatimonadales bacterium]